MSKLLKDTPYNMTDVNTMIDNISILFTLHNTVRSIIDMVKKDDKLNIFYNKAKSELNLSNVKFSVDGIFDEPELHIFRKMLLLMKSHVTTTNYMRDTTKHMFCVKGIDVHGIDYMEYCIADDIIEAINIFRDECKNVHFISRMYQVPKDSKNGICKNI